MSWPGGIRYLSVPDLIQINRDQIMTITPAEQYGVRDYGLLESSQQAPAMYRSYEQTADMAILAAVLGHSIAKNHAFYNGNKRTAAAATVQFLLLNGAMLVAPPEDLAKFVEGLAKGTYTRENFSDWLFHWHKPFDASSLIDDCTP